MHMATLAHLESQLNSMNTDSLNIRVAEGTALHSEISIMLRSKRKPRLISTAV